MKLTRACFFGKYSIRGVFITTHVHFSLSPIPCLPLWLGHYSCPFPVQLQRGLPEQFRTGGPVQAQRGASAAPEGVQSCSRGADPELLQMGGRVQLQRGRPEQLQRGSSAAPEGREHLGRPMDSTSADPACPLLRGYVLTQAIDIFHVHYLPCLLVVKPIDTPSFSTGRGRGGSGGSDPPEGHWGAGPDSPRGGRSRQVIQRGMIQKCTSLAPEDLGVPKACKMGCFSNGQDLVKTPIQAPGSEHKPKCPDLLSILAGAVGA